jgi:3-hydroxybutyryl-CoA dehydrogenase
VATKSIENICIIGAGNMGTLIALHCAVYGYNVKIFSRTKKTLQRAAKRHTRELDRRLAEENIMMSGKEKILARIYYTTDMRLASENADLVIENVIEDLAVKRDIFSLLDQSCPEHTIIATDSSSIRISRIEDVTQRREKVLNMHFLHPWESPVLELMRGTETSDDTLERIEFFSRSVNIVPLLVKKESTGFIFNRVWRAIKKECLNLVDQGISSPADVDSAWKIAFKTSHGPFGLMDMVGLDVVRDIEMVYYRESGDESDAPPSLLLDKIARGELGRKTGKGFYHYPDV